jgi:hypothetical protein
MMSLLLQKPGKPGLRLTHLSAQNPAPFMLNPGTAATKIESVEKVLVRANREITTR